MRLYGVHLVREWAAMSEQEPGAVRHWIDQQIRQARTYTFNEMQDWADAHDAEDAQREDIIGDLLAERAEREPLLARLVEALRAVR